MRFSAHLLWKKTFENRHWRICWRKLLLGSPICRIWWKNLKISGDSNLPWPKHGLIQNKTGKIRIHGTKARKWLCRRILLLLLLRKRILIEIRAVTAVVTIEPAATYSPKLNLGSDPGISRGVSTAAGLFENSGAFWTWKRSTDCPSLWGLEASKWEFGDESSLPGYSAEIFAVFSKGVQSCNTRTFHTDTFTVENFIPTNKDTSGREAAAVSNNVRVSNGGKKLTNTERFFCKVRLIWSYKSFSHNLFMFFSLYTSTNFACRRLFARMKLAVFFPA